MQTTLLAHHWEGLQEAQAPTLLFCHGYLGHRGIWESIRPAFAQSHRLLLADLPGHGQSPVYSACHTMEFMAEKLVELMNEKQIQQLDFVGHSMGGYVGLALLDNHPERLRSLTLVNSSCKADGEERKQNRLRSIDLAKKSRASYIRATLRSLFPGGFENGHADAVEKAIEIGKNTSLEGVSAALRGMRERPDRCHLLQASVPVYFVAGKNDPVLLWEELLPIHQSLPTHRQWINEGGHMSMLEDPEGLIKALLGFLAPKS